MKHSRPIPLLLFSLLIAAIPVALTAGKSAGWIIGGVLLLICILAGYALDR